MSQKDAESFDSELQARRQSPRPMEPNNINSRERDLNIPTWDPILLLIYRDGSVRGIEDN